MNNVAMGFLTGFMGDQAEKISERKSAAQDFFNNQLQLAQQKALTYRNENAEKMDAAQQTANKMLALGVPQNTVMAIVNQNPDDLEEAYQIIQKANMDGIPTDNEDFYNELFNIDSTFNPGNENVTSLIKRIYDPLSANIKADPQGFDFDPKGTIWSTMLGYNAMESSYDRLAKTEVLPGVSASAILASDSNMPSHPLGNAPVNINTGYLGERGREAVKSRKASGEFSISEKRAVLSTFDEYVQDELNKNLSGSVEDRNEQARKAAAKRTLADFPEASSLSEINKWLDSSPEPHTAPERGPTDPTIPQASPIAPQASEGSETLPNGAVYVRRYDDKSSVWRMPSGKEVRVLDSETDALRNGASPASTAPTLRAQPTPGWLDSLGSQYD